MYRTMQANGALSIRKKISRRAVDFQICAMPYPMQIFALEFTHHKAIGKSHKKIDMQS